MHAPEVSASGFIRVAVRIGGIRITAPAVETQGRREAPSPAAGLGVTLVDSQCGDQTRQNDRPGHDSLQKHHELLLIEKLTASIMIIVVFIYQATPI
jgi:hypothetical protein